MTWEDDEESLTIQLLEVLDRVEFRVKDARTKEYLKIAHSDFAEELRKYRNKMIYEITVFPTKNDYGELPEHIKKIIKQKEKNNELPICNHCGNKIKYPYFYNIYGVPYCKECLDDFRDWDVLHDRDFKEYKA